MVAKPITFEQWGCSQKTVLVRIHSTYNADHKYSLTDHKCILYSSSNNRGKGLMFKLEVSHP